MITMIKRDNIYIVSGSSGEYDGKTEWHVAAFRTQQEAHDLTVKAQARAEEITNLSSLLEWQEWHKMQDREDVSMCNEYDRGMVLKYGDKVIYSISIVELFGGNYPLDITFSPESGKIGFPAQNCLSLSEARNFRNLLDSLIRDIESNKFTVQPKPIT